MCCVNRGEGTRSNTDKKKASGKKDVGSPLVDILHKFNYHYGAFHPWESGGNLQLISDVEE